MLNIFFRPQTQMSPPPAEKESSPFANPLLLSRIAYSDVEVCKVTLAELVGVGETDEADLVAGIRGVRDQLAEEDLLLRVQRVHNDVQQPAAIEGK